MRRAPDIYSLIIFPIFSTVLLTVVIMPVVDLFIL